MWAIIVVGLVSAASAEYVPSDQVDNFFDSVLAQSNHLITVNREERPFTLDFNPFLDVSITYAKVTIRGPTQFARLDHAQTQQDPQRAVTVGYVRLGQLDYNIQNLEVNLFGRSFSTDVLFTVQDAVSPVTIKIFRNNLANCQVSVSVGLPEGHHLIHLGTQAGPAKLLTGFFEYLLGITMNYLRVPYTNVPSLFPDVTSRLERELTIATRQIACQPQ